MIHAGIVRQWETSSADRKESRHMQLIIRIPQTEYTAGMEVSIGNAHAGVYEIHGGIITDAETIFGNHVGVWDTNTEMVYWKLQDRHGIITHVVGNARDEGDLYALIMGTVG